MITKEELLAKFPSAVIDEECSDEEMLYFDWAGGSWTVHIEDNGEYSVTFYMYNSETEQDGSAVSADPFAAMRDILRRRLSSAESALRCTQKSITTFTQALQEF